MGVDDFDQQLYDAIEDLVGEGLLENPSPAYGVAQQVIHQGYDSLSPKQKTLYNAQVVPALEKRHEQLEMERLNDKD